MISLRNVELLIRNSLEQNWQCTDINRPIKSWGTVHLTLFVLAANIK